VSVIPQYTIDQIFSAAVIEEVVGEYVNLKKRGANMLGLCPFHNEKTPSFIVSPAKGIYKCFGCGRAGNVVGFLMEHEGLGYVDALKNLATKYHIEVEEDHSNREQLNEQALERESLLVALEYARKYFLENLSSEEGEAIGKSYFIERGINQSTIEDFSLGYSKNEWRALLDQALKSGFDLDILEKAGLVKHKEEKERGVKENYYDAFRERVMFPIKNISGKVVGFGGRQLKKSEKSPKYINSPETAVYNKSNILYGLDLAKNSIRQQNTCLMVEGYMDVVSLYQSGIHNVVASSGTSLTHGQIRQVKRFGENITILYDGDAAGINATIRAIDLILEEGLNVKAVTFPEGEDPDSYCQKHGATGLKEYIEAEELDFIRFKAAHIEEGKLDDPIKKTKITRSILESITKISDPIKRSAYLVEASNFLQVDEQLLRSEGLRLRNNLRRSEAKKIERNTHREWMEDPSAPGLNVQKKEEGQEAKKSIQRENALMRILILYGTKIYDEEVEQTISEFVIEHLIEDEYYFHDTQFKSMVEALIEKVSRQEAIEPEYFIKHPEFSKMAAHFIAQQYSLSPAWSEKHEIHITDEDHNYRDATIETLNYLKLSHVERNIEHNMKDLKDAENEEDTIQYLNIHHKLESIRSKLNEQIGIDGADK
jgi:DNA primase